MEHASTRDYPLIGVAIKLLYAQCEVLLELLLQAVAYVTAGTELAFLTEEGRVVDSEKHAHRRLIHGYGRQWLGVFEVGNGVANLESLQSYYRTDVATGHS